MHEPVGDLRTRLASPVAEAARALLGCELARDDGRRGLIVEVEAYAGPEDRASHARFGLTRRNSIMWGTPGFAYVYLVYGLHHCLNVVAEPPGTAAAILVRAVEPIAGLERMRAARESLGRRGRGGEGVAVPDVRLAAGPALVCAAFSIDRRHSQLDLLDPTSPLRLVEGDQKTARPIVPTPRIGIDYAGEDWRSRGLRLLLADSPSLSRPPGSTGGRWGGSPP